jgi:hypothetical protein
MREPRVLSRSNRYDDVPIADVRGPRLHRDHLDRLAVHRSSCSSPSTHIRGTLRTGSGRHSSLVSSGSLSLSLLLAAIILGAVFRMIRSGSRFNSRPFGNT